MRALITGLLLLSSLAWAAPRPARDTAILQPQGSWSVGVFNPARYALTDRWELEVHPLAFFVAPHATGRYGLLQGDVHLTAEAGLDVPTFAMRLTKGYLFPTWEQKADDIGWMVMPRLGLLASGRVRTHDVWTAKADASFRVGLTHNSATPLDSFLAPLELLFAAPLTGFLGHVGGAYDAALGDTFRLRAELNAYLTGSGAHVITGGATDMGATAARNPFIVTAHLGLDIAVFAQSRVTVGVYFANYDQGATQLVKGTDGFSTRQPVRSNNILPTVDYIWAGF